jgi:hypothetical protein
VTAGRKDDSGKLRYDLVDPHALAWLVASLTYGVTKYAAWNWLKVPDAKDRYYSALMRHLEAWRAGQDDDEESGLPHLANAMFCVTCLTAMNAPRDLGEVVRRTAEAIRRWREHQAEMLRNDPTTNEEPTPSVTSGSKTSESRNRCDEPRCLEDAVFICFCHRCPPRGIGQRFAACEVHRKNVEKDHWRMCDRNAEWSRL